MKTAEDKTLFRNNENRYGVVAKSFHWLMAVLILSIFALGLYMVDLSYYDRWYKDSLEIHKSTGLLIALLWLLRIIWKKTNIAPRALSLHAWEITVAHFAHFILYTLILLICISGYLISTADGDGISFYGLFDVPALLTGENQEDTAGMIHKYLAWGLMTVIALHISGALKHHLIDKDDTLRRMLPFGRNRAN